MQERSFNYPKKCRWCKRVAYTEVFATLVEERMICDCGAFVGITNKSLRGKNKDGTYESTHMGLKIA